MLNLSANQVEASDVDDASLCQTTTRNGVILIVSGHSLTTSWLLDTILVGNGESYEYCAADDTNHILQAFVSDSKQLEFRV
jgi:hypothetical protein